VAPRGPSLICPSPLDAYIYARLSEGVEAIKREFEQNGTDEDKECLRYVLFERAGSSDKTFQEGLKRDCDASGAVLPERLTASGEGMTFADFCEHYNATEAGLLPHHVLALRLYTTAAFLSLNTPLRNVPPGADQLATPHPFPVTIAAIADAIRRERAVGAQGADARDEVELFRGMRDLTAPKLFLLNGGAEVAPSTHTPAAALEPRPPFFCSLPDAPRSRR